MTKRAKNSKSREGKPTQSELLSVIKKSYKRKRGTFTKRLFILFEPRVHRLVPEDVEDFLFDISHEVDEGQITVVLEKRLIKPLLEMFFHPTFYHPEQGSWDDVDGYGEEKPDWGPEWDKRLEWW